MESIDGDGEFDHGTGSGWMYNVNGDYPGFGASLYELEDGDTVQWRYTTNLGTDLGADNSQWGTEDPDGGGTGADQGTGGQDGTKPPVKLEQLYKDGGSISDWAYSAIGKAAQLGFVQGSNGEFRPKASVTRAEFTKLLVEASGLKQTTAGDSAFKDVAANSWYAPYVNAAYVNGIVEGDGGYFRPYALMTREQMAATIVRALGLTLAEAATGLSDLNLVSEWARKDVQTAAAAGIMSGYGDRFAPKDPVTREMAAVVAMRSYEYLLTHQNAADPAKPQVEAQIAQTAAFLQHSVTNPVVASVGGEWTVLGLSRSGIPVPAGYYAKYEANLVNTVKEKGGKLHNVKYTEYDRVILALTALGGNIHNVAGYDLSAPLADFETVIKQGINGPIFALLALDSGHYDIPVVNGVKTQTTRELLMDFMLNREIAGGGWSLDGAATVPDPDVTAMAVQSLTPYYNSDVKVKQAVDLAIAWLSAAQDENGEFASGGSINSESTAQVVVALAGLGIDPGKDARFIKNGHSAISVLLSYAAGSGGFYHIKPGQSGNGGAEPGMVDLMATDQAMYALVAYDRYLNGLNRLYDMTDVVVQTAAPKAA
ncbi:S-layer homology domain-containing protein [Paenibacillus protaetiae]|uniref:S-layer homology domain-containing protein n=1 Tax=Paenibacillus protaetiae TaxID=2509456 RepID=UPI0013EC25A0|nr:S-layer homology domain-containing protein [Paenibacillus protaetiae]